MSIWQYEVGKLEKGLGYPRSFLYVWATRNGLSMDYFPFTENCQKVKKIIFIDIISKFFKGLFESKNSPILSKVVFLYPTRSFSRLWEP
jgi:hypothetical protein